MIDLAANVDVRFVFDNQSYKPRYVSSGLVLNIVLKASKLALFTNKDSASQHTLDHSTGTPVFDPSAL
jgi:hypothetical protein